MEGVIAGRIERTQAAAHIGCRDRTRIFSLLLAEMGHHLTAVDASPGMVDTAARNFKAAGLDIQVYEGDAAHLEREEDESYDAVVSRDVV